MTIWIQTNATLLKLTHLIRVLHHKLSSSIIYSDNLSHGFGPWGHSQYALVFAVTCMEQLNAQKHPANQGKAMKAFLCLCTYSLMHHFLSFSSAHNEAMHSLYIAPLFQFNPPVNLLHDWVGTISAWRGKIGDDGREMDTPLVSFFILAGPSVQTRSWKWEGRPQLPLCKVLCVYTSPPTRKRWRGARKKKNRDGQVLWLRKQVKKMWHTWGLERFYISCLGGIFAEWVDEKLALPEHLIKGMGSTSIKRLHLLYFSQVF